MENNYDATLKSLAAFLVANAPAGAERDLARLDSDKVANFLGLEFRPASDVGCTLYVRVEGPEGRFGSSCVEDAEGNLWYAYVVRCEVSWASWGSDSVTVCQRRLALMTEVTRFACEVERAFAGTFYRLDQTKAERVAQEAYHAERRAIQTVADVIKNNAKGLKVGQERRVEAQGPDFIKADGFVPKDVEVERKEGGRTFKYRATSVGTRAIYFQRVA